MSTVEIRNIWKIFGPNPRYVYESMDRAASRDEILKETGHVVAVRDVSLEIGQGEIFVVMGLSGSGKSTLVRCLSRLIEPTAGQVLVDQVDVTAMNAEDLRHLRRHTISMVFQSFGLFPHRRVIDNVAYGLEVRGVDLDERRATIQSRRLLVLKELDHASPLVHAHPDQLEDALGGLLDRAIEQASDRGDVYLASKYNVHGPDGRPSMRVLIRHTRASRGTQPAPAAGSAEMLLDLVLAERLLEVQGARLTVDDAEANESVIVVDLPAP